MNAREVIVEKLALMMPYSRNKAGKGLAKLAAEKLVDDLLHEESKKIRAAAYEWEGMSELAHAHRRGKLDSADLIDPYVK